MATIIPALAYDRPEDEPRQRILANHEAEQALLGIVLYDNAAYERAEVAKPDHFWEPFHARLWATMLDKIGKGVLADPISLADEFAEDPAFIEMGGVRYLGDLVDRAPPSPNAGDYARLIVDIAARRNLITLSAEIAAAASDPKASGPEAMEAAELALYALAEGQESGGGFITFAQAMDGALVAAEDAHARQGGLAGLSTGLIDLDAKLGGLAPSDLIILAARPSMGKTSMAVNIAFHNANVGKIVGFFSPEMSSEQLALRIMAERARISGDRIRRGAIDVYEYGKLRDVRDELNRHNIYIDATGGITLPKLLARARRLKARVGLDLIVVDYLQLVTMGQRYDNRAQEVSQITMGLKALAKELGVPVLALSQLSRQVEARADKKPQLSDLRESGSIEQDADAVLFLYREAYYLSRAEPAETDIAAHAAWMEKMATCEGVAECIIGKARHGPIGTVRLAFDENLTVFSNLARHGR